MNEFKHDDEQCILEKFKRFPKTLQIIHLTSIRAKCNEYRRSKFTKDATDLQVACFRGDLDDVKVLIEHNPNSVYDQNDEGRSVLEFASHGLPVCFKYVLEKGAPIRWLVEGGCYQYFDNILQVEHQHVECLDMLVKHIGKPALKELMNECLSGTKISALACQYEFYVIRWMVHHGSGIPPFIYSSNYLNDYIDIVLESRKALARVTKLPYELISKITYFL